MDEVLLRSLTPTVLAILVRRGADFAAAEDAVQDALVEAVRVWPEDPPRDGMPGKDFVTATSGDVTAKFDMVPDEKETTVYKVVPHRNDVLLQNGRTQPGRLEAQLRLQYWDPQFDAPSLTDKGLIRASFAVKGLGLQDRGVAACVKHLVANDQEEDRFEISSEPDERTLRECSLLPFEHALRRAGAWSTMAAYNRLHGTHCSEHPGLLTTILRDEWGWDGVVISDWFATRSTAASANAGLDLEMPGPALHWGSRLAAAIEAVHRADGVIAVTPVFSASYSGLFKTFFDVLEPGTLDAKPVLAAATAGTARHSLVLDHALRPLFSYLHAVVVPTGVFAATDDFAATGAGGGGELQKRVERAAGELAALVAGPAASAPAAPHRRLLEDELEHPTSFEDLLKRASDGPPEY